MEYTTTAPVDDDDGDGDTIDYRTGVGFLRAACNVQRKSEEYLLFEYLRRQKEKLDAGNEARFEATCSGVSIHNGSSMLSMYTSWGWSTVVCRRLGC